MNAIRRCFVTACVLTALLGIGTTAHAASASAINRDVTRALNSLYAQNPTARMLGGKAKAILVFPKITKAGFMVGAQAGDGALRQGGKTVGYYRSLAGSYGFQAGIQWFGYALFFMNDSALQYLHKSGGWEIGTGPSIVVLDEGMAKSLTSTTLTQDVYAFIFNQSGLMAGLGIQGSKITKIKVGK